VIRASGSTRRLVDRLALDPARLARMLANRYGFTRRDITPARASRRPTKASESGVTV
jgi:hypothetical protein